MSKWQLTLIQEGKKLRKFGECKSIVYYVKLLILVSIESHVDLNKPFEIVISRYNNLKNKTKTVVQRDIYNEEKN